MQTRKISLEETFYSMIIAILVSALIFYLLNVFLQEIFVNWNQDTTTLYWIMLIGLIVALIVSIFVNLKLMHKTSTSRIVGAYLLAIFLTIMLETVIAYLYLLYYDPKIEIEFSIALIPRLIILAGMIFFENVAYVWIFTQIIFTVLFNAFLYTLNQHQEVQISNPYAHHDPHYTILYQEAKRNSEFAEGSFSAIWFVIKLLLSTVSFGLIYYFWIFPMDPTWQKFTYIFVVYVLCNIVSAYIAYAIYSVLGSKTYRELNPYNKARYLRNFLSALIGSLCNFFLVNTILFAQIHTIGQLFIYLLISNFVIFLLSDYMSKLILE